MWAFCQCSKEHVRPGRMVGTPDPCSESDNQWQIQGFSGDISPKGRSRPSCAPSPPSDSGVIARNLQLKSQTTKCLPNLMPHRSVITAVHAEVHIPVCDLSLDIMPERGGFHYRITDLRSKCLIQTEGGLFVSLDNAKCKAAAEARNYAGGFQGPIEWTPIRFKDESP